MGGGGVPKFVAQRYLLLESEPPRPGGMSMVHKGVDSRTGHFVAIKIAKEDHSDALKRKVFEREVSTLGSLSHPNIVRLLDSGIGPDGRPFLVLDWYDRSLDDELKTRGSVEWPEFSERIARPVAAALAHAHLKGVEHRDIKPLNILLNDHGEPRLADFGIGKLRGSVGESEGTVEAWRSGIYAPPEVRSTTPYVRDVYSFGVLVVRALCDATLAGHHDIVTALSALRVPPDVRTLLERCIDVDPTIRPANGSMLLDELRVLGADQDRRQPVHIHGVWLKLTQTARKHVIPEGEDPSVADGRVMADLAGVPTAEFRLDTNGAHDRSTVLVCGDRFRYTLLHDRQSGALNVVGAKELPYEALQAVRERGMDTAGLVVWTTARPVGGGESGVEVLLHALDDFYATKDVGGIDPDASDGDNLFDAWLRLLQAREELARGERKPMSYSGVRVRKRDVEFQLTDEPESELVGTEWRVMSPDNRNCLFEGEIIDHRGSGLVARARRRRTGRVPEHGTLTPHLGPSQVALQRESDAVLAVKDRTSARPDLRDVLVNPALARPPSEVAEPAWRQDLDQDKRDAVRAALGADDLLLVKGPPGTGKTSFITELVAQHLETRPDSRVLIVSQTHVAVDNALERLDQAGVAGLVRLGTPDDPRVAEATRHLLHDRQMAKWASAVRRRAERHMADLAATAGIKTDHLRAAMLLQRLAAVHAETEHVEGHIAGLGVTGESKLGSDLGADNTDALQERLERLRDQQEELLSDAVRDLGGALTLPDRLTRVDIEAAVSAILGTGETAHTLLKLISLQAEWLQRVTSDQNLAVAFLKTTRVVAGTCVGFLRQRGVRDLEIDLCVLDEASKATATEALVPMARARRTVMVGDTNQLPPLDEELLRRHDLMDEFDLDPDFVTETLFLRLANRLPKWGQHVLREQYRMIRPIGDMISNCFYDGELVSPRTQGLGGYDLLGKPVLWLDTLSLGERRRESPGGEGGHSVTNRTEAQIVVERLRSIEQAVGRGVLRIPKDQGHLEVLVVAPYARQVDELRRRLAAFRAPHLRCEVQTVDAVQGREADLAIFSVTRSNVRGHLGFLGSDYWRRINVALSRARFGLTIVGDAEFCHASPGALRVVLDHMKAHPNDCEIRVVPNAR
jgi:predicted ATPase